MQFKRQIRFLPISLICLSVLLSCSAFRQSAAIIRTPSGFAQIGNVQVENPADAQFAGEVSDILPNLIDSVEAKLGHKIKNMPNIYVCTSNKSFCKYAGAKYPGPRAKVTPKGFFISPRLNGAKDRNEIIYHELSHVVLLQNLGVYHYIRIPVWFHEGLATYISNGGGSGNITDNAAIEEILKGNHFHPVSHENVLFPKSFSNDKLVPWMEYRQSMLFVKFLKEGKEREFEILLNAIFEKETFAKAIKISYGMSVSELWKKFIDKLTNPKGL
jgi:hypothetical protein